MERCRKAVGAKKKNHLCMRELFGYFRYFIFFTALPLHQAFFARTRAAPTVAAMSVRKVARHTPTTAQQSNKVVYDASDVLQDPRATFSTEGLKAALALIARVNEGVHECAVKASVSRPLQHRLAALKAACEHAAMRYNISCSFEFPQGFTGSFANDIDNAVMRCRSAVHYLDSIPCGAPSSQVHALREDMDELAAFLEDRKDFMLAQVSRVREGKKCERHDDHPPGLPWAPLSIRFDE